VSRQPRVILLNPGEVPTAALLETLLFERELETAAELDWEPPVVLPPLWEEVQRGPDGAKYRAPALNLVAIASVARELDGKRWVHLSVSHAVRVPRWRELVEVKEWLLGTETYCYQVIPPRSRYVNIHPNVLHLWCCLDGEPLPDFTRGGNTI
jgi:hypothetical protein